MYLGYNTNGFAFHDPIQAIELLAEIGYQSVAITIDHGWLSPFEASIESQLVKIKKELSLHRMHSVVETGARYLLDPKRKHYPTLMDDDPAQRQIRIDFLKRCIDIAAELSADCVSLWSGRQSESMDLQQSMDVLASSLEPVLDYAVDHDVVLAFEPEPGMVIDTMSALERLLQWIDSTHFQLTLDIGHLFCQGEVPIVDYIHRWNERIFNIHIEDMRAGVHEHLMFGEGQIFFPPVIAALHEIDYRNGVYVELSRHSHDAPSVAQRSYDFLFPMIDQKQDNLSWE